MFEEEEGGIIRLMEGGGRGYVAPTLLFNAT